MQTEKNKRNTFFLFVAIMAVLVIVFTAVWKRNNSYRGESGGTQILPDSPPVRAAVVTVSLEEVVLALNAWDHIVSLPLTSIDNRLVQTIKPPRKAYTSFSDTGELNFESLLSSHPNVVLTWIGNTQIIARLEQLGFKAITVHARNFDDIDRIVREVGDVLYSHERSELVRKQMQKLLNHIEHTTTGQKPVRVLWLGGTRTLVYGKKWIFHDIIEKAGGVDVTSDMAFEPWVIELSVEQILGMNPDVIIIGGWAPYSPEDILSDSLWAPISAVKNGRVYKTPDKRANFSPYAALMAVMATHWCYPEKISTEDAMQLLDTYHEIFYGTDFRSVHPEFVKEFFRIKRRV